MKFLRISLLLTLLKTLEGKAAWDTFDKYQHLVQNQGVLNSKPCDSTRDVTYEFRQAFYNVTIESYIKLAAVSRGHFVYSPFSLWLTLGAIAEGSFGRTRDEMSRFLLLPQNECFRMQYYELASALEPANDDVVLSRARTLIIDEGVSLNGAWENFVRSRSLLQISSAPIKADPIKAADSVRKVLKLQLPAPNMEGNSIIVDTLDFEGLWTDAFSDALIERAPFYNDVGKKTGYVDLMKIKKRVKMAYVPYVDAKVLELSVGFQGRYKMLIALGLGSSQVSLTIPQLMDTVFFEILGNMKESIVPIEVAIPIFRMTTEIDMRAILEELGVNALWRDIEGTRNISDPPAIPSSFIQRTTVTFDTTGTRAPIQEIRNLVPGSLDWPEDAETGVDPIFGKDFIVDKPFLFGLFDSKTYTCLFCAAFSTPTYKL